MLNRELSYDFQARLIEYFFRAKSVIVLLLLGLFVVGDPFLFQYLDRLEPGLVRWALAVEGFVCGGYYLVRSRKASWVLWYNLGALCADVLAVAAVLHCFGGLYSMVWGADYLLLITVASLFLSKRGRVLYASYCGLMYTYLAILEYYGVVPRANVFRIPVDPRLDLFCWASVMALIVATAWIGNNFTAVVNRLYRYSQLGRMASEIAHEIRTPLQTIEASAMMPGVPDCVKIEIKYQVERIARFIKEVMALGKEEPPQAIAVRLQTVVEQSLRIVWQSLDPGIAVDLVRKFEPEEIVVSMDVDQMTKVFCNLIRNGLEASQAKGGKLSVRVARNGFEWARVEILDSGHGIDRREFRNIFKPFYSTKGGTRGAGLGLAIAKKFTEANGGTVEVDSQAGIGTVFAVNIPLCTEHGRVSR